MPAIISEMEIKLVSLRALLERYNADAVLLRRVSSFAWATCGAASYVNTATTEGAASLLITRDHKFLVTNNVEAPRLIEEEHLDGQGWELVVSPWQTPMQGLLKLVAGKNLVSDVVFSNAKDISGEIARLRARLTSWEIDRFRVLGRQCSEVISATSLAVRPGMSEFELAAILGGEAQRRGIQPIVNMIAVDERNYRYRHPLPTSRKLERYALIGLNGRQRGLVCSISRLIHFGKPPEDLQHRILATARVNATLISNSQPGQLLRDILSRGQEAYTREGFSGEWLHHHQGGVTGYEPREYLATPESTDILFEGQALAWNPTVAGAKMEDTFLLTHKGQENLTATSNWPVEHIEIPGQTGAIDCALALEL